MNPLLWRGAMRLAVHCAVASAGGLFAIVGHAADDASQLALGRKLFTQTATPACALCHTLRDAGSEGAVGPNLDELKPDAGRVATAVRNGLGAMPSFSGTLSEEQILALARYVSRVSGGAQ